MMTTLTNPRNGTMNPDIIPATPMRNPKLMPTITSSTPTATLAHNKNARNAIPNRNSSQSYFPGFEVGPIFNRLAFWGFAAEAKTMLNGLGLK